MKLHLAVILFMTSAAFAADDINLETCTYKDGTPFSAKACASLKRRAEQQAKESAIAAEQQEQRLKAKQDWLRKNEEEERAKKLIEEKRNTEWLARHKESNAAALQAQNEQKEWEEKTAKAVEKRSAELRSVCGDDYKNLQIGMTMNRAQQCVAPFKLVGQLNRADGVVSTYRSGSVYAHVMNGRVVSWSK
ncbi:hypothetical protein [Rhodoferax sp.]|uniref:hypothetical protein n=1 Tax=Rhodoferax sp. TaxID=50421 RepID=UPI002ACE94EF|nr:hypothetical protein [Rhodoferax sp.]MDZ7920736.1 hypothetical protein [Rhodoferax sp.]